MKNWKIILAVVVVIFILAGSLLFKGQAPKYPTKETSTSKTGTLNGNVREFLLVGRDYTFFPIEMQVKKGETVRVVFKNNQGFHDFRVDGYEVGTKQISEGERETVEFVADKAGTFEYFCSVGNHRQQGMAGKLIVE